MFLVIQVDRPQHLYHPVRCVRRVLRGGDGEADAGAGPRHVHSLRHRRLQLALHLHEGRRNILRTTQKTGGSTVYRIGGGPLECKGSPLTLWSSLNIILLTKYGTPLE